MKAEQRSHVSAAVTRKIVCLHCGQGGVLDIHEADDITLPERLFHHLGHNPFSGDLHYRCPACGIVLLVDPMRVLGNEDVFGVPQQRPWLSTGRKENLLRKILGMIFARPVSGDRMEKASSYNRLRSS